MALIIQLNEKLGSIDGNTSKHFKFLSPRIIMITIKNGMKKVFIFTIPLMFFINVINASTAIKIAPKM